MTKNDRTQVPLDAVCALFVLPLGEKWHKKNAVVQQKEGGEEEKIFGLTKKKYFYTSLIPIVQTDRKIYFGTNFFTINYSD